MLDTPKPCPFCGELPHEYEITIRKDDPITMVTCRTPSCTLHNKNHQLIKWQQRAPDEQRLRLTEYPLTEEEKRYDAFNALIAAQHNPER